MKNELVESQGHVREFVFHRSPEGNCGVKQTVRVGADSVMVTTVFSIKGKPITSHQEYPLKGSRDDAIADVDRQWSTLEKEMYGVQALADGYLKFKLKDKADPRIEDALYTDAFSNYAEQFKFLGIHNTKLSFGSVQGISDRLTCFRNTVKALEILLPNEEVEKIRLDRFEKALGDAKASMDVLTSDMEHIVENMKGKQKAINSLGRKAEEFYRDLGDLWKGLNIAWLISANKISPWRMPGGFEYSVPGIKDLLDRAKHSFQTFESWAKEFQADQYLPKIHNQAFKDVVGVQRGLFIRLQDICKELENPHQLRSMIDTKHVNSRG